MNTQEHLQQLIGSMAIQLAEKAAQIDALTLELAARPIPKSKKEKADVDK